MERLKGTGWEKHTRGPSAIQDQTALQDRARQIIWVEIRVSQRTETPVWCLEFSNHTIIRQSSGKAIFFFFDKIAI